MVGAPPPFLTSAGHPTVRTKIIAVPVRSDLVISHPALDIGEGQAAAQRGRRSGRQRLGAPAE